MASTAHIIGIKGDQFTLEACGPWDDIRRKYIEITGKKSAKGLDSVEFWEKSTGLTKTFNFSKLDRNQINLDGGINPNRITQHEVIPAKEMTKDELKEALTELEIEFDSRLGHDKLKSLYDDAITNGAK